MSGGSSDDIGADARGVLAGALCIGAAPSQPKAIHTASNAAFRLLSTLIVMLTDELEHARGSIKTCNTKLLMSRNAPLKWRQAQSDTARRSS